MDSVSVSSSVVISILRVCCGPDFFFLLGRFWPRIHSNAEFGGMVTESTGDNEDGAMDVLNDFSRIGCGDRCIGWGLLAFKRSTPKVKSVFVWCSAPRSQREGKVGAKVGRKRN